MAHLITGNHFDLEKDIPNLSGKVYIVTGGTAGIGLGITAHLLKHKAARIILLSQNEEHAAEAQEALEEYGDINSLEWIQCDFKDLKRLVQVTERLKTEKRVDALICNAGIGVGKYSETVDGIDSHFQVNVLSQFLLSLALFPTLQANPNSRLIQQSSDLHRAPLPDVTFTSLSELNVDIGPTNLYARTKLAQILFIRALSKRLNSNSPGFQDSNKTFGPWCIATHPGGVSTDQQEQAVDAYGLKGKIGVKLVRPLLSDPIEKGCKSALFAATSEDVVTEKLQGVYIVPDRKVTDPSSQARDDALGENLWKLCRNLLREKLDVELPE